MKKHVLILEDYEDMQILYRAMFRREPDIEILSQVPDADEAFKKIDEVTPDLIIVDISLPGMNGIEFTKELRQKYPAIKVLVVTGHEPERYMRVALQAGADGLIMKGNTRDIIAAVKKLLGLSP